MERTSDELIRELARKVMAAESLLRMYYTRETAAANKQRLKPVLDALEACRQATHG